MNTVVISGRILELESRYTQAGNQVNNIRLINQQVIKDKVFENELDVTHWGDAPVGVYEGSMVILSGYLKTNKWEYEGKECSRLVVVAQSMYPVSEVADDDQTPTEDAVQQEGVSI